MLDSDYAEQESLSPSEFDKERILNLEINEKLDAETGFWTLFRYKYDYTLILNNLEYAMKKKLMPAIDFPNGAAVIDFLEKH